MFLGFPVCAFSMYLSVLKLSSCWVESWASKNAFVVPHKGLQEAFLSGHIKVSRTYEQKESVSVGSLSEHLH